MDIDLDEYFGFCPVNANIPCPRTYPVRVLPVRSDRESESTNRLVRPKRCQCGGILSEGHCNECGRYNCGK
jgi:hypothetical protein